MSADVISLEQALEDSSALVDIATDAGVPTASAKRVLAGIASLPIRQAIRICYACFKHHHGVRHTSGERTSR